MAVTPPEQLAMGLAAVADHGDAKKAEAAWTAAVGHARNRRYGAAASSLSAALAADFVGFSARAETAAELKGFWASPHGVAFKTTLAGYRDAFRGLVDQAVVVLARYAEPVSAAGSGHVRVEHRAEIFAFAPRTKRWLRLTHTGGSVAGFVRDLVGRKLVFVSYRELHLDQPEPGQEQKGYIRALRIGAVDLDKLRANPVSFDFADVRSVELFAARTADKQIRFVVKTKGVNPGTAHHALDWNTGKRTPVDAVKPRGLRLYVAHGDIAMNGRGADKLLADWGNEGEASVFRLLSARKTITMPAGLLAWSHTMRWSPDRSRLAFASKPRDECSAKRADRAAAIFVVETATGKLTRLADTVASASLVWASNTTLAFTTGAGMLSLIEVVRKAPIRRLKTRVRATTWLASAPHCGS